MATTIKELKKLINQKNLQIKNLRESNKAILKQHAIDAQEIQRYQHTLQSQIAELQEAMTEVFAKSICAAVGEDVYDDDGKCIGKRLVFKALRQNDYKLTMSEELIVPEDPKYISTITIGLALPLEEGEEQ